MPLTYAPAPDLSALTSQQRGHIRRRVGDICHDLRRVTEADPYSTHALQDLRAFMDATYANDDYAGMRLALDLWGRLPAKRRAWIARRVEELHTPQEIAARESTATLEWHVAHPHTVDTIPADAKPRERRRIARYNERMVALNRAYKIELRRRRNPHLQLVWVNDHPRKPPTDLLDVLRTAREMLRSTSDTLKGRSDEGGE